MQYNDELRNSFFNQHIIFNFQDDDDDNYIQYSNCILIISNGNFSQNNDSEDN